MKRKSIYLFAGIAAMMLGVEACAQKPVNHDFKIEKQLNDSHDAVIYPNPATKGESVWFKTSRPIKDIEITNLIGKCIQKENNEYALYNEIQIKLNTNTPGTYYAKITFEDDKAVIKKLIMR